MTNLRKSVKTHFFRSICFQLNNLLGLLDNCIRLAITSQSGVAELWQVFSSYSDYFFFSWENAHSSLGLTAGEKEGWRVREVSSFTNTEMIQYQFSHDHIPAVTR